MNTSKSPRPPLSRRGVSAAAAASIALPFAIGRKTSVAATTADVIVIGAGLAGLNAALNLESQGMSVVVLEAADYVGGRTRTLNLPVGPVNAGGQTIGPYYARLRDLVTRLKVPLVRPPRSIAMGNYVNGTLVSAADWATSKANRTVGAERAVQPGALEFYYMSRANNPLSDPESWSSADQSRYDVPLTAFLRDRGATDEAIRLMNVTINAVDLTSASALAYLRDIKWLEWGVSNANKNSQTTYGVSDGLEFHEVAGGTQRLPEAMAGALKGDVRLNQLVRSIDITDRGVEVVSHGGSRYTGKYAISAVPFSALRNIDIRPSLVGPQSEAVYQSAHGNTIRAFMEFSAPFWDDDIGDPSLFSDTAIERVFAHANEAGEVFVLSCWVNGNTADGFDQLPAQAVSDFIVKEFARIRPSTRNRVKVLKVHSWAKDSASGCCRHVFNAGQVTRWADAVAKPHGRLHFAGEQTRTIESGMEAAATTGERAAYEIIERES